MDNDIVEKEIEESMKSGKYPVATLKMFDILDNLKLSKNVLMHIDYTDSIMKEYFDELYSLKDTTPGLKEYLYALKAADIIDNQLIEKEDSFLIGLYSKFNKENAIDNLIKLIKSKNDFTKEDLIEIHNILLSGTSSYNGELIRDRNIKFVGRFENGVRIIDHFPIDCKDINTALNILVDFMNKSMDKDCFNNMYIKPFVIHGLIASLQMFSDGNTRMGRLIQHTLMWKNINEMTKYKFILPPVYATRCYYAYRGKYRYLIAELVKNNNNEVWNEWFNYNLNRIEDKIYQSNENIAMLKKRASRNSY